MANLIAPACVRLVKESLLKYLILTETQIEDFQSNEIEFINNMKSDIEEIDTVRNCIVDFITTLAGVKDGETNDYIFMHDLFKFCYEHIQTSFKDSQVDFKDKDVLLVLLCCLSPTVVSNDY